MMDLRTHQRIDQALCGTPEQVGLDRAVVSLLTTERMAVDEPGLVHGGFIFGLADHAAMLAVNDPYVVLASSTFSFHAPARVGQRLEAEANVGERQGRKVIVSVAVRCAGRTVASGSLTCVILARHVLAP